MAKKLLQRFLPKKNHFISIDVGVHEVKSAEVKIVEGVPEVVSLRHCPAPPGVWTDQFDEESLVLALKEVASPHFKEVITCIGGEKVISRIVRLPQMPNKELEAAAKFEIQKFVPMPVEQLIIRQVRLDRVIHTPRTGETQTSGSQEEGQDVLILAVPAAVVYHYHSIFSRAGLLITAIDLQAFALWRVFGRETQGTVAIVDIGAKTSHLVLVKEGVIKYVRLLPVGGNIIIKSVMNNYGLEFLNAEKMIIEGAVGTSEKELDAPWGLQMNKVAAVLERNHDEPRDLLQSDFLEEGLQEITRELHRSLEFYSNQENVTVEKLILCGGTSKLKDLTAYLQDILGIPIEVGIPDINFSTDETFNPQFAVAVGLALREAIE